MPVIFETWWRQASESRNTINCHHKDSIHIASLILDSEIDLAFVISFPWLNDESFSNIIEGKTIKLVHMLGRSGTYECQVANKRFSFRQYVVC